MIAELGSSLRDKISRLKNFLNKILVGREKEVNDVLITLFARENLLLVAPPGTAKTTLINLLAHAINAKFFKKTASQFDVREDYMGYLDLDTLIKHKKVRYIGLTIKDAEILFIDEIFRSSAAVRNLLLEILAKRTVDGVPVRCIAFYSASNFISNEEEDTAFIDRLLKNFHGYVGDEYIKELIEKSAIIQFIELQEQLKLLNNQESEIIRNDISIMDVNDILNIIINVYENATKIASNKKYIETITKIRRKLVESSLPILSDRSLARISKILIAYLHVTGETFTPFKVLRILPMFSRSEDEYKEVLNVCSELLKEYYKKEIEIVDSINAQANTILQNLNSIEQSIISGSVDIDKANAILNDVISFSENAIKKLKNIAAEDIQLQTDQAKKTIKFLLEKAIHLQKLINGGF